MENLVKIKFSNNEDKFKGKGNLKCCIGKLLYGVTDDKNGNGSIRILNPSSNVIHANIMLRVADSFEIVNTSDSFIPYTEMTMNGNTYDVVGVYFDKQYNIKYIVEDKDKTEVTVVSPDSPGVIFSKIVPEYLYRKNVTLFLKYCSFIYKFLGKEGHPINDYTRNGKFTDFSNKLDIKPNSVFVYNGMIFQGIYAGVLRDEIGEQLDYLTIVESEFDKIAGRTVFYHADGLHISPTMKGGIITEDTDMF